MLYRLLRLLGIFGITLALTGNTAAGQEAFDLTQWATVSPAAGWQFLGGQVAGDSRRDVVGYQPSDHGDLTHGSLWVGTNTGAGFGFTEWATVSPATNWVFQLGNFSNARGLDVVGYHPSNGTIWVGTNTGSRFSFRRWATVTPAAGWIFVVGQFAGDGRDDIVGYYPGNGTIWVGVNTGTGFAMRRWARVAPADGWTFLAGQFAGDGSQDLFGYHPSDNGDLTRASLWIGTNTGAAFTFGKWATISPAAGWTFLAGQFAGNGRRDVLGYHPSDHGDLSRGSLWVGTNTGTTFTFAQWASFSPAADWTFLAGQFAGDQRLDAMGYYPGNGTLWVFPNTGVDFSSTVSEGDAEQWAQVDAGDSWRFLTGQFSGEDEHDIVAYQASNGNLSVGDNRQPFKGYAWPLSAAPGEQIDFMVSGRGSDHVTFLRHGVTAVVGGTTLTSEESGTTTFVPTVQPLPPKMYRDGAGWPTSFTLTIPTDWPSGIYSAHLRDRVGDDEYIPFIVKADAAQRSGLALLANVNTWLAYNTWGGKGKYDGASHVSFLRPDPRANPGATGFNPEHLTRGELLILSWLSGAGYPPDVYTDIDFHNGAVLNAGYHTLVFGTHPEYWTEQMYDNLKAFLDAGGSVLYLGGNGIYEKGSYNADQTGMVFLGGSDTNGERPTSALFRMDPLRPERAVLGVATARCGVDGGPYAVETGAAGDPLLAGTNLDDSDVFGAVSASSSRYYTAASGLEVDTSASIGLPGDCGNYIGSLDFPVSSLPAGLRTLARGQHDGPVGAEMVTYDHPAGGLVFSASSISFGSSLAVDPALQQILLNALSESARRAAQ